MYKVYFNKSSNDCVTVRDWPLAKKLAGKHGKVKRCQNTQN